MNALTSRPRFLRLHGATDVPWSEGEPWLGGARVQRSDLGEVEVAGKLEAPWTAWAGWCWPVQASGLSRRHSPSRFLKTGATYAVSLEQYFAVLADWWKQDPFLKVSSNPVALLNHPAFRALASTGAAVVPLVLRDYQSNPEAPWDLFLERVVESTPCSEEHRGKPELIRQAWLDWGRQHGLLA